MPIQVFGFGFNSFGQISKSEKEIILTPTKCLQNINENSLEEVNVNWSSITYINDQNQIEVQGYYDNNLNQTKIIHPNSSNRKIKSIAKLHNRIGVLYQDGEFVLYNECNLDNGELDILYKTNGSDLQIVSNKFDSKNIILITGRKIKYLEELDKICISRELEVKEEVKQLSCGKDHNLLVTKHGNVCSWGLGSRGQLGHGDMATINVPRHVEDLGGIRIKQVECGGWHSVALAESNDLYTWGWNESGQTGFAAPRDILSTSSSFSKNKARDRSPIKVEQGVLSNNRETMVSDDGVAIALCPRFLELEQYVSRGRDDFVSVVSVSCGTRHTCAVLSTGDVLTWGWGKYGQLGRLSPSAHANNQVTKTNSPGFVAVGGHALAVFCGPWGTYLVTDESS